MDIINAETGEATPVQIFVGVLGASNYTYCEASATQRSRDWIASHDDPRKRFITTLFCYGCNLGATQTARSVKGLSRRQVMARDFDRQVAEQQVRAAILNRFTRLGTPTTVAMV